MWMQKYRGIRSWPSVFASSSSSPFAHQRVRQLEFFAIAHQRVRQLEFLAICQPQSCPHRLGVQTGHQFEAAAGQQRRLHHRQEGQGEFYPVVEGLARVETREDYRYFMLALLQVERIESGGVVTEAQESS